MPIGWPGSLSTPLAQACGEFLRRFVFGQRLSKQSFKVVNWSDTLLSGEFLTVGAGGGIDPLADTVTVQIGQQYSATIPGGSFKKSATGSFTFEGAVGGVAPNRYSFEFEAPVALDTTTAKVAVSLTIRNNTGTATVTPKVGPK